MRTCGTGGALHARQEPLRPGPPVYGGFHAQRPHCHLGSARPARHRRPAAAQAELGTSATEIQQRICDYKRKGQLRKGRGPAVYLRRVDVALIQQSTDLLADSFIEASASTFEPYRRYLRRQIETYVEEQSKLSPKTLLLAALTPRQDQEQQQQQGPAGGLAAAAGQGAISGGLLQPVSSEEWMELEAGWRVERKPPVLAGVVEVQMSDDVRSKYLTLNAPGGAAYMCNMAVAPAMRRQGLGELLVQAAEEVARMGRHRRLFLHARLQDAPACALYGKMGYARSKTDSFLVPLLGLPRRFLMVKEL